MTRRKLIKEKSLYTIKNIHTKSNVGDIYEHDYVTINRHDDIYDDVPMFSESNFKFKIKTEKNGKKRHVKNSWIMNGSSETWTKNDISTTALSEESKIVLKPNYNSLKDFAYYGSAVELIKATIKNIVAKFPGGLYYYGADAPEVVIGNTTYYKISNECQIDCWSKNVSAVEKKQNPLRILSYSYSKYKTADGTICSKPVIEITGSCLDSIIGTITINNMNFSIYKDNNGINHLLTTSKTASGVIIEPSEDVKNEYWNNLSDFERVLLNRNTRPLYKAIFDTPFETETGLYYTRTPYVFPTVANTMTPDLTTYKFQKYIESLMSLAEFHDEYDSNNIWRMMTHESIKNLDNTFISDDEIDYTRMKALLQLQGLQFDEIKRYIDNLKVSSTISYNGQGNMPDYFLTDVIENYGWETKNVCLNNNELTPSVSYSANGVVAILEVSGNTSSYVNSNFIKRLILSSDYLNLMKGTKKGIEAILGMFGFKNDEYEIIEYVAKCLDFLSYDTAVCYRESFDSINEFMTHSLEGYPLTSIISGSSIVIAPWYDSKEKYEGDFYYQSSGGWGKVNKKFIDNSNLTIAETISGASLYRETQPHITCVKTLNNMTSLLNNQIKEGMICYVENINGIENYLPSSEDVVIEGSIPSDMDDVSHYFILKNPLLSGIIGGNENSVCDPKIGWRNVPVSEITNGNTEDAIRILNVETMYPNFKGNNPHTGNDNYDFGFDYLDKFRHLFREAIKNGDCDKLDQTTYNNIENFGFNIEVSGSSNGKSFDYVSSDTDEWESYKIINTKMLTIRFNTNNDELRKYIMDIVIPYLENMLPSTMIVEYLFKNEPSYVAVINNKLQSEASVQLLSTPKPADEIPDEINIWGEDDTWMNN